MLKHILVVEDDSDIREVVELILNDSGYQVNTSATATEFFNKLETYNPDLIILDINLPDGDGRELCKAIRANVLTREIPVMMMSAHMDLSKSLKDVGATDFLPKPFDINNLVRKVDTLVNGAV